MEFYPLTHIKKPDLIAIDNNDDNYRKYILSLDNKKPKNTDGWLIPTKLLPIAERKSGNKIIEADLIIRKKKVVVKISKNKDMLKKDYDNSLELSKLNCPNFARYYGFFSCKDDIDKYAHDKKELPKKFCMNDGSLNYFLFMEFYPYGNISDYTPKNMKEVLSIINQVLASQTLAFEKMNFLHNDLHPANILIKKTDKKSITYLFSDKKATVETEGIEVIIFDFDRSVFDKTLFFGNLLSQLSFFIAAYEIILQQKKLSFFPTDERPLKKIMNEFMKITSIKSLKDFFT